MKFKKLLGIFFFLTLITTTVFGFTAENSRQGFDRNFTELHQGVGLSKAAPAPGFLVCFLDSSRQVFLSGQGGKPNLTKATDKLLKDKDIDAHSLKQEYLGKKAPIAQYDLFVDKNTGFVYIMKKVGGTLAEAIKTWVKVK